MSLNDKQVTALLAPLHPGRVRQVQGNAHLEAWDIRRHLIRVFGWGGWDFTVVSCDLVSERSNWDAQNPLKGRHTVVYRVIGRLTIKDEQGTTLAVFEDGATGDAANQPSLGDAHDMALKTAMSQALKRCAVNLGDRFGLSLYAKGSTDAVVGGSLAHQQAVTEEHAEDVESGELDHEPERKAERVKGDPAETTDWNTRKPHDPAWVKAWEQQVGQAETTEQWQQAWRDLTAEVKAGALSDAQAADLKQLWQDAVREQQVTNEQRAAREAATA